MKKLSVSYPWASTKQGQGFFIPCLDVYAIKEEGLQEALRHRVFNAKAQVGVKAGLVGVWFFR